MLTPSMTSPERPAHARRSDPISSHITLASLGKDTSLKARVLAAAFRLEERGFAAWNDTVLTEQVEHMVHQRQQRNVIARTRDLMTPQWFTPVGLDTYDGRELMHYKLSDEAKVAP